MPKIYKPRASIFEKLHNFIPLNKETVVYLDLSNGGFFIKNKDWLTYFHHFSVKVYIFAVYV